MLIFIEIPTFSAELSIKVKTIQKDGSPEPSFVL